MEIGQEGGSVLPARAKVGKHDRRRGNEQTREGQGQRRQSAGAMGRAEEGGRVVQMTNAIKGRCGGPA